MQNPEAIAYLESPLYLQDSRKRQRAGGGVVRAMFNLYTDHKFNALAMEEAFDTTNEFAALEETDGCEECGPNPIILGPDGADHE